MVCREMLRHHAANSAPWGGLDTADHLVYFLRSILRFGTLLKRLSINPRLSRSFERQSMLKTLSLILIFSLTLGTTTVLAKSDSASYYGGTMVDFKDAKKEVKGKLITTDEKDLQFLYGKNQVARIPYDHFIDIEYGQKSGRRVGAAVATTILLGPLGLLTLFSKKQNHFLTLGFTDDAGKEQVAVFKINKDMVRTILPILEARSGKKVEYQSKGAEKKATGKSSK